MIKIRKNVVVGSHICGGQAPRDVMGTTIVCRFGQYGFQESSTRDDLDIVSKVEGWIERQQGDLARLRQELRDHRRQTAYLEGAIPDTVQSIRQARRELKAFKRDSIS